LRGEVEKLLAEDSNDSFLHVPARPELMEQLVTSTAASSHFGLAGLTVCHYNILEMLGAGGMGVVYKAFDTKLHRFVALKFLPPYLRTDNDLKRRLKDEAHAAAALDHPNIVVVHDIDETPEGDLFIAMAFHEGVTLREKIAAGLPVREALEIARQIASGLAEAHKHGIVHRDIKPGNVIVATDGVARIIDFGLAKSSAATASMAGSTRGTPLYMSPEQASGKPIDFRTDLWSLGAVLYEMIAGRPPFPGEHAAAVIHSVLHDEPARLSASPDFVRVVEKALKKDPRQRYGSAHELEKDLAACLAGLKPHRPAERVAWTRLRLAAVAIALIAALAVGAWLSKRNASRRWAREQVLPEIARLARQEKYFAAVKLAQQAQRYIPENRELATEWSEISREVSIDTKPTGAEVALKEYSTPDAEWTVVGRSPMPKVRVPLGLLRWRVSKPGYSTIYQAWTSTHEGGKFLVKLQTQGAVPDGMVQVPAGPIGFTIAYLGAVGGFDSAPYFIDKYEVTNRHFKEFVDRGGYARPEYWKQPFIKDGRVLSRAEAMAYFHDATGRPGPAEWEVGHYREGQDDFPVGGLSWYEAAAYAEFAGKSLPTISHWYRAADPNTALYVIPLSNFSRTGPARVGRYQGISAQGAYDLAGNAREWCWNDAGRGLRYILGGAWNGPSYSFYQPDARSPWDRGPGNGFRCVKYTAPLPAAAVTAQQPQFRDFSKEKPVSDQIFAVFRSAYAYDQTPSNGAIEAVDESFTSWRMQKVSYNGPRGRITAFLFLPRDRKPPFQTVIYFPSAAALTYTSSDRLEGRARWEFLPPAGRAVLYPIYMDTFERHRSGTPTDVERRERMIEWSKEVRRSVDYLDTRTDIDHSRIAYMGASMGAAYAPILAAFEGRFRAIILQDAGFFFRHPAPDIDQINFAPRLKAPTLMVSGRYDFTFPYETSQLPMFRLLGAPPGQKRHAVFNTAHDVSIMRNELIREVLDWLDRYLGRVA
ncbi:MAG: protein kinase, partial [Acidobacteriaceae bacterium]|nr:protein kinase [Acidobacteriaceae bacterium]